EFLRSFGHCTRPFDYLGLPALAIPFGFTGEGLPCGFQLVGRPFDEATLFRAGRAFERGTGCTDPAPAL
ncbi:MAG: amidase family protein, partial [Rhodospirillales bacterium]|nr:amidase family protein [Rhodospirillales bacterium]